MRRFALVAVCAHLFTTAAAESQSPVHNRDAAVRATQAPPIPPPITVTEGDVPTGVLVAGGLAGLAVSAIWIHGFLPRCVNYDYTCVIPQLLEPLAAPAGVHLANGGRGSLGGAVARSYLIAGFGLLVGAALGAEEFRHGWPVTLGAIAAAQLAVSVGFERSTARARRERGQR